MATQAQRGARVSKGDWSLRRFPEAASQSFERGELIYLVAGKVTVCADDATSIAGIAMEDASGTTDNQILIAIPSSGATLISSVYHSTPASAITAITQPGTRYGYKVVSNKGYIDIEDTTNLAFLAKDIILPVGHSVGDVYGYLEFEILDEVNQLSGRDDA
jgi:hypothetical protein